MVHVMNNVLLKRSRGELISFLMEVPAAAATVRETIAILIPLPPPSFMLLIPLVTLTDPPLSH